MGVYAGGWFGRATAILLLLCALQVNAETDVPNCAPEGVAVGGYDLVSYHSDGGPVMGTAQFSANHGELKYHFASAANLATFQGDTERYLPVYSGFCAATLAMGSLVCPDYTNFKLEEGRLLLFELAGFTNGRTVWNSDPVGFRQRADANFARFFD